MSAGDQNEDVNKARDEWSLQSSAGFNEIFQQNQEIENITGMEKKRLLAEIEYSREQGSLGGKKAAANMTPEERKLRARTAFAARDAKKQERKAARAELLRLLPEASYATTGPVSFLLKAGAECMQVRVARKGSFLDGSGGLMAVMHLRELELLSDFILALTKRLNFHIAAINRSSAQIQIDKAALVGNSPEDDTNDHSI